MTRKIFLLIYLFVSTFSFSQQTKIDSLQLEFSKTNQDTIRLRILKEIAQEAYFVDSKTYKSAAKKLLELAKKTNNIEFIGVGHNAIGRYYEQAGADSIAKRHYLIALQEYKKINHQRGQGITLGNIAALYIGNSNIDSTRYYLHKSIVINTKNGFEINLLYNYYNLAIIESKQSNSKEAIKNIRTALYYAEKLHNNRFIAYCNALIGVIYMELEMYDEAEKFLIRARTKFDELDDSFGTAQQYVNLGKLYNERDNNYLKAIKLYKKAVDHYSKIGDSINRSEALGNIGRNFLQSNQLDSAKIYINKSLTISKKSENPDELVRSLTNLGEIGVMENELEAAKRNIYQAILIAKKYNYMEHYSDALAVLSNINVAEGNYKNAYQNFLRYKEIEDSIKSSETKEMIVDVSTKYQTEKKEKENLTLKKQNAEQQLAVQKATNLNQRYGFIALTLVLGIIGIFYYSKTRRRKLRDEHIINIAKTKQKEHEKIGADLHSTKTKDLEKIASALEEKGEAEIASKVREVKANIRLLSHELFQIPFSQSEFDDQIINLLFEYNSESLKITHQGIHTIPWPQVNDTIKRNLYLIISEAISNIKNHSGASEANLKFQKNNKNIDVTITDNGIGFTEEDLKKGHGIGNIRMRVNEIKGSIRFDAIKNQGSEIGIFITAF